MTIIILSSASFRDVVLKQQLQRIDEANGGELATFSQRFISRGRTSDLSQSTVQGKEIFCPIEPLHRDRSKLRTQSITSHARDQPFQIRNSEKGGPFHPDRHLCFSLTK